MSISIKKAFKTIVSPRYNMFNIFTYICLNAVLYTFYNYFKINIQSNPKEITPHSLLILFLSLITSFIIFIVNSGYRAIITNNEINKSENAFPSLSDFFKIISNGAKLTLVSFLWSIVVSIIMFVPMLIFLFQKISVSAIFCIFTILLSVVCFIGVRFLIPIVLMFYKSLKFKTLFAFDKTKLFLDNRRDLYAIYLLKLLLLMALIFVIGYAAAFIIGFIIGFIGVFSSSIPIKTSGEIAMIITISILIPFSSAVFASFDAQFINSSEDF